MQLPAPGAGEVTAPCAWAGAPPPAVSPLSYHNKMIGMSPVKWNQGDVGLRASSHWLPVSKAVIPLVARA